MDESPVFPAGTSPLALPPSLMRWQTGMARRGRNEANVNSQQITRTDADANGGRPMGEGGRARECRGESRKQSRPLPGLGVKYRGMEASTVSYFRLF